MHSMHEMSKLNWHMQCLEKSALRSKTEINFQKAKNELRSWEICAHLELKTQYQALKNILIQLLLKTISTKN